MPALSNEQLPILAGALLRLRGLTLAAVFEATGIRAANLSAWLKGKPQVISAPRVAALMHHLGVQGGQLRSDIVHTWTDQGDWAQLRTVFTLLQDPVAPRCLFLDEQVGLSQTRFLQWGYAWVRMTLTPGPTAQDDLAGMVRPDRIIVLPVPLEGIPTQVPQEVGLDLWSLAEQGGREIPSRELAHGFMQHMKVSTAGFFVPTSLDAIGWAMLEATLRKAMRAGMRPEELALKIQMMLLGEANPAPGRNEDPA